MIRLTLNPDDTPKIATFKAKEVIIGKETSEHAHFKIDDSSVSDVHVKIINEEDRFLIINAANDPFTSLNGLPFGKKTIKNHDLIQIGDHTIHFEVEEVSEEAPQTETASPFPVKITENQTIRSNEPNDAIVSEDFDEVNLQDLNDESDLVNIEALLKEVDELSINKNIVESLPADEPPSTIVNSSTPANPEKQNESPPTTETPDHTILELGDSPPNDTPELFEESQSKDKQTNNSYSKNSELNAEKSNNQRQSPISENWKILTGLFIALVTFSTIICSGVYFRASGKNSQEENKIAAGIADIAMAMTHAQLNHITPNKQNWSDPDFIQNNLACVLSPNLHTQAQIDSQGQFTRYPYILRVYTSSDISRFVVLAQPAPNLMQWLINKKTIVIDSTSMEMRKITDLKKLNRLLANPNPFEAKNGAEISRVIKEGSLMSLASLAGNKNNWGFIPPKALAFVRPGAENYIYNAPRYYPFGETILRTALSLNHHNTNGTETSSLQEELEELSNFPDIVLYTSQGMQSAIEAQKAITALSPNSKFLLGYVKFNDAGYVASSHIFVNDDLSEISLSDREIVTTSSLFEKTTTNNPYSSRELSPLDSLISENCFETIESPYSAQYAIDTSHPLYLRLHAIASSRSQALAPLGEEISTLIHVQNVEIHPDFKENVTELLQEYLQTDNVHRTRMIQELAQLYQEYSEMPLEDFMKFIEASMLTSLVNEALKSQQSHSGDVLIAEANIEKKISSILETRTLGELDDTVLETGELLNLEQFPDLQRLVILQEKMHSTVLDKLSQFLLSPESIYANANLEEQDRTALVRILKSSWVTDTDEFDFFLSEFDHIKNINARYTQDGSNF